MEEGEKPKYSVSFIIPKSDTRTIKAIQDATQAAYEIEAAKLKGNGRSIPPLSAIKTSLRDGDVYPHLLQIPVKGDIIKKGDKNAKKTSYQNRIECKR